MDILPNFTGVLVRYRFHSYFSDWKFGHSLCNAQILRQLIYFEEQGDKLWAREIKKLLHEAKKKKDTGLKIRNQYIPELVVNIIRLLEVSCKKRNAQMAGADPRKAKIIVFNHPE